MYRQMQDFRQNSCMLSSLNHLFAFTLKPLPFGHSTRIPARTGSFPNLGAFLTNASFTPAQAQKVPPGAFQPLKHAFPIPLNAECMHHQVAEPHWPGCPLTRVPKGISENEENAFLCGQISLGSGQQNPSTNPGKKVKTG